LQHYAIQKQEESIGGVIGFEGACHEWLVFLIVAKMSNKSWAAKIVCGATEWFCHRHSRQKPLAPDDGTD